MYHDPRATFAPFVVCRRPTAPTVAPATATPSTRKPREVRAPGISPILIGLLLLIVVVFVAYVLGAFEVHPLSVFAIGGIDYGMGRTNIDPKTGIRFGVISQHSLASWFFDDYESQYGDPTCPKCGNPARDVTDSGADYLELTDDYDHDHGCTDYACDDCRYTFDSSDAYPDDPIGHELKNEDYHAVDCLDSDVMILRSPYYTYAPFCSPCVPGAGNLDSAADPEGDQDLEFFDVKAYCFGHDYFENHRAPYRVFRVEDDTEVLPDLELCDGMSGTAIVRVPPEAIDDCSHSGQCDDDVSHWISRVSWLVGRANLVRMLREYGAWDDLETAETDTLRARALWVLCCDESDRRRGAK